MGSISRSLNRQEASSATAVTLQRLICTSSLQLLSFWSMPRHVVPTDNKKGKSHGEHRRWHIQPCTYRCRRQRAQWYTSMSWELWARPMLTPVPCRRTHSSQRPQRLHYCLSGPWCLAFRDCRQSKDTPSPANPSSHMPLPESVDGTNQPSKSRVH